jgi:hypothetical protein
MKPRYDYTESLFLFRGRLGELCFVALVLAVGTELIAHGLVMSSGEKTWLGWSPSYTIAIGSGLALLGLGYIVLRGRLELPKKNRLRGVLIVSGKKNNTIAVDGYDFSEKITQYFSGLSENKALKEIWQNGDLSFIHTKATGTGDKGKLTAVKLVREAIEYYVLNSLSLHLSGHFNNNPDIADKEIERLGREDIPKILLQNHFLELFSRPMAEREAFFEDQAPGDLKLGEFGAHFVGKVVYQIKENGERFEHFELILPKKSTVTRLDESTICIDTKRFTIKVSSVFEGFGYGLPRWFEPMYLGTEMLENCAYKIKLNISVNYKLLAFLSFKRWNYYRWIDSFLDQLDASFSFERFIDEIGWGTACTVGKIFGRRKPPRNSGEASSLPGVIELVDDDSDHQ